MAGPAWEAVLEAARKDTSQPDLADQDEKTNVHVLAAAIVYARTGDIRLRTKVESALKAVLQRGNPGGRTLAWARNAGAYAMAADLIGYRTPEFEGWLRLLAEHWKGEDGRTLRETFATRPNNWGAHGFGTLCAIYRYLGDYDSLRTIRDYWVSGVVGPNPGYRYGDDVSWHVDSCNLRWINPAGAEKDGFDLDGIIPDDMRRGTGFQVPPEYTNYAWEGQQGLVMAARILDRAGMPIWEVGDRALYRAAAALQERLGDEWKAAGDDRWMLAFYDAAYGTDWSRGEDVWAHGKNTGWAYVVLGELRGAAGK